MLSSALADAMSLRRDLLADADECVRVLAGAGDGAPGVIVDRFGRFAVATVYDPGLAGDAPALGASVSEALGGAPVLVRAREDDGFSVSWSAGPEARPDSFVSTEAGLRFEVRADPRHDFGLYLDGRAARAWVRAGAGGARVLNLFAYTCGFGVAAAAGGAAGVTNVDPSRDYLTWGRRNAALNGFDFRVIPDTAQAYLARLVRRMGRGAEAGVDILVVDPPAFGVGRGDARVLRKAWPDILDATRAIAPGRAVMCCNDRWLRERRDFAGMVGDGLGSGWDVSVLPQDLTATGADPEARDPWYLPPVVVIARRL